MEKLQTENPAIKSMLFSVVYFAAILSVKGVDEIINYAGILLGFVYPVVFAFWSCT